MGYLSSEIQNVSWIGAGNHMRTYESRLEYGHKNSNLTYNPLNETQWHMYNMQITYHFNAEKLGEWTTGESQNSQLEANETKSSCYETHKWNALMPFSWMGEWVKIVWIMKARDPSVLVPCVFHQLMLRSYHEPNKHLWLPSMDVWNYWTKNEPNSNHNTYKIPIQISSASGVFM